MTFALVMLLAVDFATVERLIATGNYRGALDALETAPQKQSVRWCVLASKAHDGLNDPKRAVEEAEAALALDPKSEAAHLQLGQIFLTRNTPLAAFDIFKEALALIPGSLMLRLGSGLAAKELKRYEQAIADLSECLRGKPGWALAFDALGGAYLETYRPEELIAAATEYRERNPADFRGWYYLAAARSVLERQDDETERQVRESIRLNPRFAASRGLLGKILVDRGQLDAGIPELEQAVALRPNDTPARMRLANAYRLAGRTQDAARELARVAELRDQEPESAPVLIYRRGRKQR